eukprot:12210171-Alexandrium_andersonii.AAC.1
MSVDGQASAGRASCVSCASRATHFLQDALSGMIPVWSKPSRLQDRLRLEWMASRTRRSSAPQ